MYKVAIATAALLLSGCSGLNAFNPNGSIEFKQNPTTGEISYTSTKNVSVEITKPDGTVIKVMTDAVAGVRARAEADKQNADNINELVKRIPVLPAIVPLK